MPDVQVDPYGRACACCNGHRIPIIGTYAVICPKCDGWPPRLEPPTPPVKEVRK